MQIMIECEYCGSLFDFNENHSCPNCAAVPDKKKVAAAKAAAKAESKKVPEYAVKLDTVGEKPPSGMFITVIVKLIPLWIFLIIFSSLVPAMAEKSLTKKIYKNLQVIEEVSYVDHSMNEDFIYDNKMTLNVDDAFYAESEIVKALLPEGMKLLVVHIKGSLNENEFENYNYSDYSRVNPYITNGTICREKLSYSALNSIPEVYGTTTFNFTNFYGSLREKDGYWCFIVDENDTDISLCFGDYRIDDYALSLEEIHRINIVVSKEGE